MYTKYYTISITDTSKAIEERKHKKILRRRRIRRACGIVGTLAFFYLLGVVGGLEQGMLTIKEFSIHSIVATSVLWASIKINDEI
jgi:hypothetical protein